MRNYALNREQLRELLLNSQPRFDDPSDGALIELARNWECELVVVMYHVARIVLGNRDDITGNDNLIERLFSLENSLWISLNEGNVEFVEFMLQNLRQDSLSLEEELVSLTNKFWRYDYETSVRL